ncbi:MAG: hypothetical protein DHS20C13_02860 [Thermodesulfobacteriota bacterium]|nr:MAG: hypothetical protein DHS20C13_02860 [Thermodesulfobacteriota bacterium]
MGLSTYAANKVLDHLCGTANWSIPTTEISLHSTDPGLTGANEVSAGWYSRKQPASGWNVATTAGVTNNGQVTWDAVIGSDVTVTHIGLWDTEGSSNFLFSIDIANKTFTAGSVPKILDGTILITPGAAYHNDIKAAIADHLVGRAAMAFDTSVHLALYTVSPTQSTNGTEAIGGSYARQSIDFDAAASGATDNTDEENFPTATADLGTILAFAIRSESSGTAGNMHLFGALTSSIIVNNQDEYKALVGAIDFTI